MLGSAGEDYKAPFGGPSALHHIKRLSSEPEIMIEFDKQETDL